MDNAKPGEDGWICRMNAGQLRMIDLWLPCPRGDSVSMARLLVTMVDYRDLRALPLTSPELGGMLIVEVWEAGTGISHRRHEAVS